MAKSDESANPEKKCVDDKDLLQVHLAEFKKIEDEIAQRSNCQHQMILVCMTTAGAAFGVAFSSAKEEVLLAIPAVFAAAMLIWADHDRSIIELGRYIASTLRVEFVRIMGTERLLMWEAMMESDTVNSRLHKVIFHVSYRLFIGLIPLFASLSALRRGAQTFWFWEMWVFVSALAAASWCMAFCFRDRR